MSNRSGGERTDTGAAESTGPDREDAAATTDGADPDTDADTASGSGGDAGAGAETGAGTETETDRDLESLREAVEAEYDFEDFGPAEMRQMSREEWEAVFDADTWITGPELLDRVETDLRAAVERRDVFAVVEREHDTDGQRLLAYSDEGYAYVHEDGTVEGRGTVLRDVESVVALCSMEDYEPQAPDGDGTLPPPGSVERGGSSLGNTVMQVVGVVQLLAGVGLLAGWFLYSLEVFVPIVAVAFILFGAFVLVLVANARLSDRFRAEEYRDRLAAVRAGSEERPEFVPEAPGEPAIEDAESGE